MNTADQDYFLDAEGNLTTDTGEAATLLIRAGQEVPKDMADRYGIGKVAQEGADEGDTVEKASTPASNKAAKKPSNKGAK